MRYVCGIALGFALMSGVIASAAPEFSEEYISPPGDFPANHGSSLAELKNGDLLSCWYAGSREGGKDVQIYCRRWDSATRTWGKTSVAVKRQEKAVTRYLRNKTVGNTVLHLDDEGYLWLFYSAVTLGGWSGSYVDYKVSADEGRTWSEGRGLIQSFGNLPRHKALRLDDCKMLLPLYHEFIGKQGYACTLTLKGGKITKKSCTDIPGEDHLQPALLAAGTDEVYAYLRSSGPKQVRFSKLDVRRGTWSKPIELSLPNPNAPVDVVRDAQNDIWMVYNDSASGRVPLSLAVSADGKEFRKVLDLERAPSGGYSYPYFLKLRSGDYLLSYTFDGRKAIKLVRFNEEWLQAKKSAR